MNAIRMRMIGAAACLPLLSAWCTPPAEGASALDLMLSVTAFGQVQSGDQLTRDDVDRLLRQATAAIEQGDFDGADAILRRTEKAGVHYPLLHMGATPSSVRRALTKAQNSGAPRKPSTMAQAETLPSEAPRGADLRQLDPFAGRNPNLPVAPASKPHEPLTGVDPSRDPAAYGAEEPQSLPAMVRPLGNPLDSLNDAGEHGAFAGELPSAPLPAGRNGASPIPDAPLPPGVGADVSADMDARYALAPQGRTVTAPAGAAVESVSAKQQALHYLAAARKALESGNLSDAEKLAREASALGVPESQFLPNEDRPSQLAWDILRARDSGRPVTQASAEIPGAPMQGSAQLAAGESELGGGAQGAPGTSIGVETDQRYALAPDQLDLPPESPTLPQQAAAPASMNAKAIMAEAEKAMAQRDLHKAEELYSQAYLLREQLDPKSQEQVMSRLQMIAAAEPNTAPRPLVGAAESAAPLSETPAPEASLRTAPPAGSAATNPSLLDSAGDKELVVARQLSTEISKRQTEAIRLREKNPQQALEILREARAQIESAEVSPDHKRQLLGRIDITIRDTEKHYEDNRAEIELAQQNAAVESEVALSRETKLKVQERIAQLVNEYNKLKDEQRFAEMEVIAQRLRELAPDEQVTQQIWLDAKFIRRTMMNSDLVDRKENSFWVQMNSVEESAVNPVAADGRELVFDQKYWEQFAKGRTGVDNTRRSERELEIERRLRTPVQLKYQETPLSEVIDDLQQLSGVNIHLDPRGLSQEGVHTDTPVTVSLNQEISLKSALNLILEPLHLSYIIKDEVLKITSEQLRNGELKTYTYNVADLVIPIPNFVPSNNIGLQGLINDAHKMVNQTGIGMPGPSVLVNDRGGQPVGPGANNNVLAQQFAGPASTLSPSTMPIGSGPGGMGAAANADFDSLIDLIVSTVQTDTWAENGGGEAEIRPFPTNLSLVISQTQAVHEEIADLLAQLRRLQDLQVTIEVRFIRLNDSFFERIGIDFDMNIEDKSLIGGTVVPGGVVEPGNLPQSATVGLQRPAGANVFPNFTADLDVPFRQDSFDLTQVTQFGGPVGGGLNMGFAILSDIEAYFLIEAAQGDQRTNILNAPKVTLFNGQQAFVADSVQRPFVIGVIPVVGEFAAAQQPVIVVLSEGTMMTIQAVVSDDRRYVRLTVVPFFTQIGDVDEFTFEGSSSTTSSSSTSDDENEGSSSEEESESATRSGVTVQLPSFQLISVVTTVSVPDGGTVLLGGIKRLSEGRNEYGVPLLSKLPYVNRLFRNVSIGRETDSLMMMVTPRIIIQEEEEERLLGTTPGQ